LILGQLKSLRASVFAPSVAGTRCLLDEPSVGLATAQLHQTLLAQVILRSEALAIQAIAFDKAARKRAQDE
jgi:hypothetical protein